VYMLRKLLQSIGPKKHANSFLGVDIGTASIKVCLLEKGGDGKAKSPKLLSRTYDQDLLQDGNIIDGAFVARELRKLLDENDIGARITASALSSYSVITKRIAMPSLEKEALESSVRLEVENIIPFPLSDIYYSYYVMGIDNEREGMMNLLIVAAKKEIVDEYAKTFELAGLDLSVLDVDIFAITNMIEQIYNPKEFSVLAADIGASVTKIAIVKGENIEFTREILIGGKYLTEEISKTHGLSFQDAEQKKLNAEDEAAEPLQDFVSNVSSEINKTINFYVATKPRETVGGIYLTGGSALIRGLKEQIERETGIHVEFMDPFLFLGDKDRDRGGATDVQAFLMPVALYLSSRAEEERP
jgi:type IV pilus assembly protein PilM